MKLSRLGAALICALAALLFTTPTRAQNSGLTLPSMQYLRNKALELGLMPGDHADLAKDGIDPFPLVSDSGDALGINHTKESLVHLHKAIPKEMQVLTPFGWKLELVYCYSKTKLDPGQFLVEAAPFESKQYYGRWGKSVDGYSLLHDVYATKAIVAYHYIAYCDEDGFLLIKGGFVTGDAMHWSCSNDVTGGVPVVEKTPPLLKLRIVTIQQPAPKAPPPVSCPERVITEVEYREKPLALMIFTGGPPPQRINGLPSQFSSSQYDIAYVQSQRRCCPTTTTTPTCTGNQPTLGGDSGSPPTGIPVDPPNPDVTGSGSTTNTQRPPPNGGNGYVSAG